MGCAVLVYGFALLVILKGIAQPVIDGESIIYFIAGVGLISFGWLLTKRPDEVRRPDKPTAVKVDNHTVHVSGDSYQIRRQLNLSSVHSMQCIGHNKWSINFSSAANEWDADRLVDQINHWG